MNDRRSEAIHLFMRLQSLSNRYQKQRFPNGGNPNGGQGLILALLNMKQEITQKELTELSGMTKQSVGQLLDKLEKRGYITREQAKNDRRVSKLKLTEDGAVAMREMEPPPHARERGLGFDCLSDEELQQFNSYMSRIIERLEELVQGGTSKSSHETRGAQ
jgi:DNA-binding MarR family transcriptional regulator